MEVEREVDFGKFDIVWFECLNVFLSLLKESVIIIVLLLLIFVILIIGNIICLLIMDKKDEI